MEISNNWQHKWALTKKQLCDCGAGVQTTENIVNKCSLCSFCEGMASLYCAGRAGIKWLSELELAL